MNLWLHVALGAALAAGGWCVLRTILGVRFTPISASLIDGLLPLAGFVLVLAVTGKPIFAGIATCALVGVFGVADRTKRGILCEPIVFTDVYQTFDVIFRHPEVNLLFNGKRHVLVGALVLGGLIFTFFVLEPSAWSWSPWPAVAVVALASLLGWVIRGPLLPRSERILRRLAPTGDPLIDAGRLGPFAMQFAYSLIARAERPRRCAAGAPFSTHRQTGRHGSIGTPVVVVQCESFFDPRRLHPKMPSGLLATFDACRSTGVQWGRLSVPGTGANSVRTEFAVLTGLTDDQIGFDRFNPYLAFARSPIRSLAWRMRAEGYRTICVHPFDRHFYRRDLVIPNLGFDVFMGEEAFAGAARAGPYIADIEVARVVAALIDEEGPGVFVFAITMENHGPWHGADNRGMANLVSDLPEFSERRALNSFLHGISGADAMLRILTDRLQRCGDAALLAFYGDHLPGFPKAFAQLGLHDTQTDYVVWQPGRGCATNRDLAAHDLSQAIWTAWESRFSNAGAANLGGGAPSAVPVPRPRVFGRHATVNYESSGPR